MQIENQFQVAAPPETVFAFLLDINRVVGCMPGAELSEVVDPTTFKGKVKSKVGPITVPGSANATATMSVLEDGAASTVKLVTDFTVAGRVANFGRGVMEDVSRRLVGQMADCIKSNLEGAGAAPAPATAPATEVSAAEMPAASDPPPVQTRTQVQAKPVNALTLFFQVLWDRIRRLFGSR
ncbi:MAG: hypothetical protein E6I08_02495 [Chloroflexi bacterium]|nr:MAG: hypothetical protein E6I08_02495 [Chloroflexota bacterium]